ncbi:MAG TPA: hypothetical protein VIV11_23660 [Kofleriaceae bacterium]
MIAVINRLRAALVVVGALAATAYAQSPNPNAKAADEAFKQGRELYKQDKFAEACEQFDKSHKLDPAYGTLFNLSQCSEKIGKLATAATGYREVVERDTNEQRKATAAERLKEIAPRIPKLYVKVDKPPLGLVVELDSKVGPRQIGANQPVEVDFADYSVLVRARGNSAFMSRVKINQEGKTTTIEATLAPGASNAETAGVAKANTDEAPRSRRRLYAIGAMATGGAVFATGIVFGALARSQWKEAKDVCGGTSCTTQADVDRANDIGDKARSKATLSTVFVLGGAAIAGVGVYLWVTAPGGTKVTPTATDTSAGVSLSGEF